MLVVGIFALLHSARFHQYLLRKADQIASEKLGTSVTLQNFSLHLSNLGVDLFGITVDAPPPHSTPPLVQVQHVALQFRVVSIWDRKWYFENIRADDPVVRIFTDARGISNLPALKSTGSSNTNIFQLGVRHASLHHGELFANNKKIPLDADLRDVSFFLLIRHCKKGGNILDSLSYRDGQLQFGSFNPLHHNLEAKFKATPNVF